MRNTNYFKAPAAFGRWVMLTFLLMAGIFMNSFGQNVNVTGATNGNGTYLTLGAAFTAISPPNVNTGAVISVSIVANTTETATATLGAGAWASVSVTCTTPVTVTGSIAGAIIRLNGADNVTIDGRIAGTGNNITVSNTSVSTSAGVWLSSAGVAAGCLNNVVRNLNVNCGIDQSTSTTVVTVGILMGGSTISLTIGGDDNDNNSFLFNNITKCRYGIATRGQTGSSNSGNNFNITVSNNIIGPSAFGSNQIGRDGIFMQCDSLSTVTNNEVRFVGTAFTQAQGFADRVGIAIGTDSWNSTATTTITSGNYTVTGNIIHDIIEEKTGSAVGLLVGTTRGGQPTNNLIANNFIYNVRANGTSGDCGTGIGHVGSRGDKIVFNSILMTGDVDPAGASGATTTPLAAGITKHSGAAGDTAVTIKNNVIYIDVNSNANLNAACIITPTAPYNWGTGGMNNNDYYFPPANTAMRTGGTGTGVVTFFATLANWQTAYAPAQDGASIQADPFYLSSTDLHATSSSSALNAGAVPIAGVTTDIDGQTRDVSTPDIGADEFTPPAGNNMGATALVAPVASGCRTTTEAVTVTIKNYGIATIDFSVDNVTVNATATGPNAYSSSTVLTTGTLAPNASMNVTLPATFDMTAQGTYTFNANTSVSGDVDPGNNAMAPVNRLNASLGGTYTVGTGGNFTTLTAAAAAFNGAICISSNVVFSLINTSYPSETFPITFNANSGQGMFTVTIKPTLAGTTISGSSTSAPIISLNGADYFIIDGSISSTVNSLCPPVTSASRDLTITNTSTSTASAVILLGSLGTGQGATNNVIKNCNLSAGVDQSTSTTETYGIAVCTNFLVSTPLVDGPDNNNNTFENNNITKVRWGIILRGSSTSSNTNNIIRQNIIGPSAFGANQIGKGGVIIQNQDQCTVTGNEIRYVGILITQTSSSGSDRVGIGIGGSEGPNPSTTNVTNSTITKNNIHDINEERTFSALGIVVAGTGTPSSNIIANNFINNVRANGTSGDMGIGICIAAGNGDKVVFNTVNTSGDIDPGTSTTATQSVSGIRIVSTTPSNLTLKNNMISVDITSNTSTLRHYAISAPSTAYAWGTGSANNNDYYTNAANTQMALGGIGTTVPFTTITTLASWKTQFTPNQDAASIVVQPVYTSATDLHLQVASNGSLDGAGSPVAGITDDYDCEVRNVTTPDIGADEFTPPVCATANGGTATGSTTFCGSGTPVITATGYSTGSGTTYQWISSTNIGDYPNAGSAIGGQTNPASLTTGVVSTTTYFWLRVTCATDVSTANSNMITVTVTPSIASISPPSVTICAGQSTVLTENGGTGTSWSWSTGETTQSISVSPAVTTSYVVTVTSPGPCTTSAAATVTVTTAPTGVLALASDNFICVGAAINLTSSADVPPATILTQDFESGAPGWLFQDSSSTGVNLPAQIFHIETAPYNNATGFSTFSNFGITGAKFAFTNADEGGTGSFTRTNIVSPPFSTVGYTGSATLSYKHGYKYWSLSSPAEEVQTQISINGGTTWTNLASYEGADVGITTNNSQTTVTSIVTIPGIYMGQPDVRIRFRYRTNWGYYWAIDDISITGTPVSYTYSWTSSPAGFTSSQQNPTGVTPSVSTTYTVAVSNGACSASASTAQVVVNPNPVINIASQTNVTCNGDNDGSVDLDATVGLAPYLFDLNGGSTTDGIYTNLAPGSYPASVVDDNGCESTPITVTITEPPLLTLGASSNSPACTGGTLNLTSTPGGGTPGYSYSWSGPNSFTAAIQNPSISPVTAAAAGTYTVTVTDDNGCTETTTTSVSITTGPTAAISNFGNNNICLSQPATVTLAFTGTGPWNYTVSDGTQIVNGSTPTSPVNINITPTTAGTHNYTVTAVSDANCPAGTSSGTATVFVSTAPPTNNAGPVTPSSPEACSGTVLLINTTTITGQNVRYSWNTGSNSGTVLYSTNIGGPFSPPPFQTTSPTVYAQFGALAGSSGYNVCVQGTNGCGSGSNKCTWIRGVVSVPGAISPANPVACPNNVKTYSCGTSAGATVYNWTLSGSATPITSGQGTQNVTVTFPAVFTSGQLCVTAALACGGSSTSAPRCMTISNTPAVPGTMTGPAKVCPGATGVVFSVAAVTGATGYNWTVPAGCTITSGTNTPSITVNFPNPYLGAPPVCVSATSACASSAAKCKTVGTNLPGQPGAMSGPTTNICNSTVQYSIPNVPGATSYNWTNPAGTTITSGQGSTTILLSVSSTFSTGQLTVVASTLACTPGNSPPRTISIAGKPNQPGTITANPAIWCTGGFVNFSVSPVSPLPVYNWTTSNGTITAGQGTNNIDVTWGATAAGTVNVTAGNTCGTSTVRSQPFSSGCREEGKELAAGSGQLTVYPNPAHDKVTVSIDVTAESGLAVQLMDVSGRVVLSENKTAAAGFNTFDLDLTHLSKGVYMLEIKSAQDNWKRKVVVE